MYGEMPAMADSAEYHLRPNTPAILLYRQIAENNIIRPTNRYFPVALMQLYRLFPTAKNNFPAPAILSSAFSPDTPANFVRHSLGNLTAMDKDHTSVWNGCTPSLQDPSLPD